MKRNNPEFEDISNFIRKLRRTYEQRNPALAVVVWKDNKGVERSLPAMAKDEAGFIVQEMNTAYPTGTSRMRNRIRAWIPDAKPSRQAVITKKDKVLWVKK